jgi:hypothetical protein
MRVCFPFMQPITLGKLHQSGNLTAVVADLAVTKDG